MSEEEKKEIGTEEEKEKPVRKGKKTSSKAKKETSAKDQSARKGTASKGKKASAQKAKKAEEEEKEEEEAEPEEDGEELSEEVPEGGDLPLDGSWKETIGEVVLKRISSKKKSNKSIGIEELNDIFDLYALDFDKEVELKHYLKDEKGITIVGDDEDEELAEESLDDGDIDEEEFGGDDDSLDEITDDEGELSQEELEESQAHPYAYDENALADDFHNSDPVKQYLREIGKYPVLKGKDEEVALAKRIANGEKAKEMVSELDKIIAEGGESAEEAKREKANQQRIVDDGESAKEELTNCNLKLVISIAKHYLNRGMQFLDLIQEGNIGLMKAVEKFDYTKGFKFSTYATWWIRQAITRALADQARTIRIPVHMVETINKITRTSRKLTQKLNRDPTAEEISKELATTGVSLPPERIREIQMISLDPLSLEKPVGEEEDSHVGDFIEDKDNESPVKHANSALRRDVIDSVLSEALTDREERVIRLRYGLEDGRAHTLEEVGKEFGVTRERIRQIEAKAIKKLRHQKYRKQLEDYQDDSDI